jgi:hypothetical protein
VVTVVILTFSFLGLWWRRNPRSGERPISQSVSPEPTRTSEALNAAAPSPSPSSSLPDRTTTSETIVDGNMRLQIQSNGTIEGLGDLSPDIAAEVKSALSNPADLAIDAMHKPPSRGFTLMGASGNDDGALTSPVGVVVREQQPNFKWIGPAKAEQYEVVIRELSTDEIVASTEGSIRITNWTSAKPLKRGHLYGWTVVASAEGNRVRIPSSGTGMFKVLDESGERRLQKVETQVPRSRLVLGIVMYRLGLVDQAQREFELLKETNPDSQLIRSLNQRAKQTKEP